MKVADHYDMPDKCPKDCSFKGMPMAMGQGSMCFRCPVLLCRDNPKVGPIIEPEDYRPDWAKQWQLFFEGKVDFPMLSLEAKHEGGEIQNRNGISSETPGESK